MNKMDWSEKQLQTIKIRGKNVLVSAAAGSGKTAVLTERILQLVTEDKVPVSELLVVTFTEAAASEMKSRIAAALTAASENSEFAETQLRQLSSAKIMTFHAFCLTILRKYYYVIDFDPSFSIADEKRAEALKEEALDEVIASAFTDEDDGFYAAFTEYLLAYADVRNERKVREQILKIYEFIMTLPSPFAWLAESVSALSKPEEGLFETAAIRFANEEIKHRLATACALVGHIGEMLSSQGLDKLAAKNTADYETVSQIERSFLSGNRETTRRLLRDVSFEQFRADKNEKETFEDIKELVKQRRDRVKKIIKEEVGAEFFARPAEEYAEEIAHVAPYARTLEILVQRFSEAYARIKQNEKVIDFNDFEHKALEILGKEGVADDYKRRLSYIFIDEYQDSNDVQEELISGISSGDNVFMVGDVKQSIYSWRNAAPEIFLEKKKRFSTQEAADSADICIGLSKNYRSKAGIIDAVNAVFETIIESHYSGMDYDEGERLVTGVTYAPEAEGKTTLHILKRDTDRELFDSDTEGEAAFCASIISEIVGKRQIYDARQGSMRFVRYGDIAILLRAASGAANVYKKTLESHLIPAATDRGEGYYETVEIDTFLGLLRAIVNLRRDVPLAAAMCSAVFKFELAELADIRADKKDGFFHTAFLAYAENGADAALREKCACMTRQLANWRDEERFMRLDDFLWKLMRESGFYDYAGTMPRGLQRQANLRALLDQAASFQSGRIEGLREFLAFLDKIKMRGGVPQVTLLTDGEDVCRIMTIHGSKGLEFPVVLLGGLGKPLAKGGFSDDTLLLHRAVGLSLLWKDSAAHTHKKTLFHSALKLKQDIDERAEAIRLLYVGMTRAMDELHLVGTLRDPEKWEQLYDSENASPAVDTDIFGASNYLQLLLPTALKRGDVIKVQIHEQAENNIGDRLEKQVPGGGAGDRGKPQNPDSLAAIVEPFVYTHAASAKLKSKYSVSEISKKSAVSESRPPTFYMSGSKQESEQGAALTAAEQGTALHTAFELMDFREACANQGDPLWFEALLSGMVASGALSKAEADSVGMDTLMRFAESSFASRAAASGFLMKEAPFNMKYPIDDEEIVVQGVIDCLFEEEDGFVIADYKSGWFNISDYDSEADRIREAYGMQMHLYRRAAERIFGKPVKESLIYMTRAGVTVDIFIKRQ